MKIRFQEVVDERTKNDEWLDMNSDDINLTEIKETPENAEQVRIAKEKELSNFDEYDAFEEVEYIGQEVLGTRYVLTEKSDGAILV